MKRFRNGCIFAGISLLMVLLGFGAVESADQRPTNVGLLFFDYTVLESDVRLEWETASELDTEAFKLLRASGAGGPFEYLSDIGLIPAIGNPHAGAHYERTDETSEIGQTYWYQLVEIEADNSEIVLATIEVFVDPDQGVINPPGGGNENTPPAVAPTSTDIPTITPIPSETPLPTETAEPTLEVVTASPEPTGTPLPSATSPPRQIGPTATAFRFPTEAPPAPGDALVGDSGLVGGVAVVEAAGIAGQDDYPGANSSPIPGEATSYPVATQALRTEATSFPGDVDNGGANRLPTATTVASMIGSEEPDDTNSSRIVLWLGFAGGLLILAGGVFFSISLATRRN